jgi:MOSC domain-containing protein
MPAPADELRECLAEIVRMPVPDAPARIEPLRFYRQWLAERNLGLVPIAEVVSFDWPGQWLAVLEDEHAVVMFGSPSGVWLDPAGAYRERAQVTAGWMATALDLHLPIELPRPTTSTGTVAAILVAPAAEAPLARVEEARALAGRGLEGDRYAAGAGTFTAPGLGYELTLVEAEVLDEIELPWEDARRNVVTSGIELNALVGRRFRIGGVDCVGRRLAEPCAHLERLARPGLLRPLVHRGGLRADILVDGLIAVGDPVSAL